MERPTTTGTLIRFDEHARRVRRVGGSGAAPAECYALGVYAASRDRDAARTFTPDEVAMRGGAIDASDAAHVRRYVESFGDGPEAA